MPLARRQSGKPVAPTQSEQLLRERLAEHRNHDAEPAVRNNSGVLADGVGEVVRVEEDGLPAPADDPVEAEHAVEAVDPKTVAVQAVEAVPVQEGEREVDGSSLQTSLGQV